MYINCYIHVYENCIYIIYVVYIQAIYTLFIYIIFTYRYVRLIYIRNLFTNESDQKKVHQKIEITNNFI